MASLASQLVKEVTAHAQSNSFEDAREICADGIYFPNNVRILITSMLFNKRNLHVQATVYAALRVRTHQQSQVESNPVQSDSQRRGRHSVAYLQWQPQQCVHTNRVESSRVESSRVESSPVPRVLPNQ